MAITSEVYMNTNDVINKLRSLDHDNFIAKRQSGTMLLPDVTSIYIRDESGNLRAFTITLEPNIGVVIAAI